MLASMYCAGKRRALRTVDLTRRLNDYAPLRARELDVILNRLIALGYVAEKVDRDWIWYTCTDEGAEAFEVACRMLNSMAKVT